MTKTSTRAHRFSVLCAIAAVVWLGWSPLQASAADGATAAAGSTVDASLDPIDGASDTVTGTVDTVSNTLPPSPVDRVSNTASGTIDTVSNTASGTISGVSNSVGETTAAAQGTAGHVGSATDASFAEVDRSSATTGDTSLRSSFEQQAAATHVESATRDEGHGSCVAGAGTACLASTEGNSGSWTRSVADILKKLLALTGSGVLAWVFAASFLALAGIASLHRTRDRSELGSASPS